MDLRNGDNYFSVEDYSLEQWWDSCSWSICFRGSWLISAFHLDSELEILASIVLSYMGAIPFLWFW